MNRYLICIFATLFLFGSRLGYSQDESSLQGFPDGEILEFFKGYFSATRTYNQERLAEFQTEETLEAVTQRLLTLKDEDLLTIRKLIFNEDLVFGSMCKFFFERKESSLNEQSIQLSVLMNDGSKNNEFSSRFEFNLIREAGDLKIGGFQQIGRGSLLEQQHADIDICSIPINWQNPALLKPGESIEEQRCRLGIKKIFSRQFNCDEP